MPEIIKGYCQLCIMQSQPKDIVEYSVMCLDGDTEMVRLCEEHLRLMLTPFIKRDQKWKKKQTKLLEKTP